MTRNFLFIACWLKLSNPYWHACLLSFCVLVIRSASSSYIKLYSALKHRKSRLTIKKSIHQPHPPGGIGENWKYAGDGLVWHQRKKNSLFVRPFFSFLSLCHEDPPNIEKKHCVCLHQLTKHNSCLYVLLYVCQGPVRLHVCKYFPLMNLWMIFVLFSGSYNKAWWVNRGDICGKGHPRRTGWPQR